MTRRRPPSPRLRDASVLLPLIGVFLWMPPLISLFAVDRHLFGVPLVVVYLFGVWITLISCALWISRHLADRDGTGPASQDGTRDRTR